MSFLSVSAAEPRSPSSITLGSARMISRSGLGLNVDQDKITSSPTVESYFPLPSGADALTPALNMVIRQDPFSMTLDASALLTGSLLLLAGMHFVPRALLESTILAVPLLLLVRNDYHNFLRLGPGGTPPTLTGYFRLAWFRLFVLRDTLSPPPLTATSRPARGVLPSQDLSYRPGPRPTVAGIAPQRQLDQHGSAAALAALRRTVARLADECPARFGVATSCLERHGFALFARHPVNVCGNGEIFHIHSSDRSMHMNLHPEDIAELLRKGWGERHPLAWGKSPSYAPVQHQQQQKSKRWSWLPEMKVKSPLPETFVMTYAPRGKQLSLSSLVLYKTPMPCSLVSFRCPLRQGGGISAKREEQRYVEKSL